VSERRFLLDTSALLAWLEGEAGTERVRALLRADEEVYLPWPVLMETFYISAREKGEESALQRYAAIKQLPVILLGEMSEPVLLTAARLKARHPISIADALIAAYALQVNAILVHQDPEYDALVGTVRMEPLPYKTVDEAIKD
jgi:predicted nucleic acid-binding protein